MDNKIRKIIDRGNNLEYCSILPSIARGDNLHNIVVWNIMEFLLNRKKTTIPKTFVTPEFVEISCCTV